MSNHVDTITVEVTDFEPKLYVQAFELNVAVNSIPCVSLNVLPVEPPAQGSGKYVTASAPGIRDITDLYSRLLEMSLGLDATATIKIRVETHQTGGARHLEENQEVELRDWILTDVGLSTVSAIDAPILTVVFCHPVVKLDRTGCIYEEVKNKKHLTRIFKTMDGNDPISYMDSLYKAYASGDAIKFYDIAPKNFGGPREEYQQKVRQFRTKALLENLPGDYIEGNTGGLFLAHVAPTYIGNIRIATGYTERPHAFCDSTWSRLVRSVCPSFLTHIVPTYDRPKLLMEPFSPWQERTRNIDVRVAMALDVVSADPAPIIGAAILKDAGSTQHVVSGNVREQTGNGKDEFGYSHAFYFPERAMSPDVIGGILELGESRMVSYIVDIDRSSNATVSANAAKGKNLQDAGNSVTDERREHMDEAYVKAMFLINYRKNCKASVTTVPIFKDASGNMLYPGRVTTVHDDNEQLFHGYVIRMTVKGTAQGGGSTYLEMSHARPAKDGSTFVDEGTENPCYPKVDHD